MFYSFNYTVFYPFCTSGFTNFVFIGVGFQMRRGVNPTASHAYFGIPPWDPEIGVGVATWDPTPTPH